MQELGTIYMLTSPIEKSYIGQTWSLKKRLQDHACASGKCRALYSAIKKYGFDSFKIEILHQNISDQEELNRLEILEIKNRKTVSPKGYNIRLGGDHGKMTEETKALLRDRWKDPETKKRRIEAMKDAASRPERRAKLLSSSEEGRNSDKRLPALIAAQKTAEMKAWRSKARAQEWSNPEIRKRRIDSLKETNGSDLARARQSEISKKHWQNPEYREKLSKALKGKVRPKSAKIATAKKLSKPVLCIETGLQYKSSSEASQSTGICRTQIINATNGKALTAGGFHWKKI